MVPGDRSVRMVVLCPQRDLEAPADFAGIAGGGTAGVGEDQGTGRRR